MFKKLYKINGIKLAQSFSDLDYKKLSDSIYVQGNFEDYNYFDYFRKDLIRMYKPLNKFSFNYLVKDVLDMHNMDLRLQLYIKSKAKVNIGNQCGTNHCVVRYSNVYEVQRQSVLGHNFVKGENYL